MCAVCLPILFFKYFSFVCKKNLRKATKPQFMFSVGGCKVAEGCVHVYVFVYVSTCTCQCIRIYIYIFVNAHVHVGVHVQMPRSSASGRFTGG